MKKIFFGIITILSTISCKKDWVCTYTTTITNSESSNYESITEVQEAQFKGTNKERKNHEIENSFLKVSYYSLTDSTMYDYKTSCL